MPTKLYVGNLAYSVTNEDLEGFSPRQAKSTARSWLSDKFSGQSRGFGFVEMADSNEAARPSRSSTRPNSRAGNSCQRGASA